MTTDYYIYAYVDPATDTPFYIGAGHNGRDTSHGYNSSQYRNSFLMRKIKDLLRQGIEPSVHRILIGLTRDEAFKIWRSFFIGAIGRRDLGTGPLYNLTSGGEGGMNFGPETKARHTAAMKKAWGRPEHRAKILATVANPKVRDARSTVHRNLPPRGKYKGIWQQKNGKWMAQIKPSRYEIVVRLGTFDTPEEAAQAYNDAVDLYWDGNGWKNPV